MPQQQVPGTTTVMPVVPAGRKGKGKNKGVQQTQQYRAGNERHEAHGGMMPAMPQEGRPSKAVKAVGITVGALVILLAGVYIAGGVYFTSHFYPNTSMGTLDLSLKGSDEASSLLTEAESDYALAVTGQGLSFEITSSQAGVGLDARAIIEDALSDSDPWLWPLRIAGSHDETDRLTAASDSESLAAAVQEAVDAFNATAEPSADAYVSYDADAGQFVVKDEVYGKQVSADAVVELAAKAIASMQSSLALPEDVVIKPTVLSTDSRLATAAEKANVMVGCDVVLVSSTDGTQIAELDGSIISQWVTLDDNLEPTLDSEALNAWATELASSLDTVGTSRTYTRPDGKEVTVSGGDYGWAVDNDALISAVNEAVAAGTKGEITIPCSSTGNGYTKAGQDWGAYCDVDLSEQHAYYYDASGNLLWDSGVVTGKPNGEDDTPTGVYYLKNLQTDVSLKGPIDPDTNEPEWDSPVDYWMPFVGNLIGLHDASWQPSKVFSDSSAYKTYGSHGCVNLPTDKAGELFGIIKVGDPVIVHW